MLFAGILISALGSYLFCGLIIIAESEVYRKYPFIVPESVITVDLKCNFSFGSYCAILNKGQINNNKNILILI